MADTTTAALDPDTIEAAAFYDITIVRVATVAGIKLKPRNKITLRGDLVKTLLEADADVVRTAVRR